MDELETVSLTYQRQAPEALVVTMRGECDLAATRSLEDEIEELLTLDPQEVVIDMSGVTFMDTSGIAVLLRLANHFGTVEVRDPNPLISRTIEALGLAGRLRLHIEEPSPTQAFVPDAGSIAAVRHFVRGALRDAPEDVVEVAELLASEVATNAFQYSGREFTVAIERTEGRVRIGVTDNGDGEPTLRKPDVTAERGRGLQLVEALSSRWSVEHADPGAKTVWFEIAAS